MEPSPEAGVWAAHNARHFRKLLYAATALFLVTEAAAFFDVVPHLRAGRSETLAAKNCIS
jgi:hypothetical protein